MKRVLLHTVIATLVLAALVGIYVFLLGSFGKTEAKILFTTLAVSYFSVTSLACAAAYEKKRYPLLSLPGLALGVVGFLLFIPSIWAEWFEIEAIGKAMGTVGVISFSFAQACLLSLGTLERRLAWVYYAAVASVIALAAIISGMIVFEAHGEWVVRVLGVVGILDGCFSLCVPILYWLGGKPSGETAASHYEQIELACPRCAEWATYSVGNIRCRKCSLVIRVQIEGAADRSVSEESP